MYESTIFRYASKTSLPYDERRSSQPRRQVHRRQFRDIPFSPLDLALQVILPMQTSTTSKPSLTQWPFRCPSAWPWLCNSFSPSCRDRFSWLQACFVHYLEKGWVNRVSMVLHTGGEEALHILQDPERARDQSDGEQR